MLQNHPSNDFNDYHRFEDEQHEFIEDEEYQDLEMGHGVVFRKIESKTNNGLSTISIIWKGIVVVFLVFIGATIFMFKRKINQQIDADHMQNINSREILMNERGDAYDDSIWQAPPQPVVHSDPMRQIRLNSPPTEEIVWHILTGNQDEMTSQNKKWAVIRTENKEKVRQGETVVEPLQIQITDTQQSKSRDICYEGPNIASLGGQLTFQVPFYPDDQVYDILHGTTQQPLGKIIGKWYRNWNHALHNPNCEYLGQKTHYANNKPTGGERPIRRCPGSDSDQTYTWQWWEGGSNQGRRGDHLAGGMWTTFADPQAAMNLEAGYQNQNGTTCYHVTRFDNGQKQFYQIDFDETRSNWKTFSSMGCAVQIDISDPSKQRPVCQRKYQAPLKRKVSEPVAQSQPPQPPVKKQREKCWMTIATFLCPEDTFCCNGRFGDSCCADGMSCGRLGCGDDGDDW